MIKGSAEVKAEEVEVRSTAESLGQPSVLPPTQTDTDSTNQHADPASATDDTDIPVLLPSFTTMTLISCAGLIIANIVPLFLQPLILTAGESKLKAV